MGQGNPTVLLFPVIRPGGKGADGDCFGRKGKMESTLGGK